ncbi:hypothetical protein KY346_06615 [Candidatus Woesearchaeota archaeon]|nr:hypothetical protein [Candidatus Woesearchaeota archaeon]
MKNKLTVLLCVMILLLASTALAISSNYETTYVSRIVGSTAAEMKQQLSGRNMGFDYSTYYSSSSSNSLVSQKQAIIKTQFTPNKYSFMGNSWRKDNVKYTLKNNPGDQYLIFEPSTSKNTMEKSQYFTPDDITEWQDYLEDDDSLVIFDSAYSGLYLTNMKSFAGKISPYATYIAPASYSSPYFVKALLCNMGKYDTIGEVFRQARNNYYWHTKNQLEYIGLTLLSYSLFGMPTSNAIIDNYDTTHRKMYCKDFDEEFETLGLDNDMQITSTSPGIYTKNFKFRVGDYNVTAFGNFSIIEADNTDNMYGFDELVLPVRALTVEFPLKTIVQNFSYSLEDPVDLTVKDLPMWDGLELVERECYRNATNASVEFSHVFTDEEELVIVVIHPAKVVDCNEGKIKLFQTVKYQIDYVPYSPILINSVEHPAELLPSQRFNATINIENIQDSAVEGEIHIKQGKDLVSKLPVSTTKSSYDLEVTAPSEEGIYAYTAEFIYENSSRVYADFSLAVKVLDAELIIPERMDSSGELELIITSQLTDDFDSDIEYSIIKDGAEISSGTKKATIESGENNIILPVSGLSRSDLSYEVLVYIPYMNTNKVVTGTIITNHAPAVLNGNLFMKENETFALTPDVIDLDDDAVTVDVTSPFSIEGYAASFEDSGEYLITIEADDGYTEITKQISLEIENVNRPPRMHDIDPITIQENESFTILPEATDPDNINSVDNDDNNITFYYASLFDEDGKYKPAFDESGNYTIEVTVSDGEYYDSTFTTIQVLNTNRPPIITVNDTLTVYEEDLISLEMLAYDPDNKNNVTNDDNVLTTEVTAPLDANASWQTTDEDSGEYNVKIKVSDGEFEAVKDLTIKVLNLNRAPEISNLENITVDEGALITLSPIITDMDNLNNVTNDDNIISINYPEPFSSNGTWQTGYEDSGEYLIAVTVSDGITQTVKEILVTVNNVNRAPAIDALDDIQIKEGESITITPSTSDPDNENSVTNDNNNLTITYSELIDSDGTYDSGYADSGDYTITATVSDGELSAETSFNLKIDNVNRAPVITAEDVHVKEGALINFSDIVQDPDNENEVSNDDNVLDIDYPEYFNKKGIWQTDDEDSGEYEFTVSVSDGEFNVTEEVKIIIDNLNRAPVIEVIDDFTVSEGDLVEVDVDYYDLDNQNGVTNDDNNLNIQISPPLDSQGKWQTGYFDQGTYDMSITVSDGDLRTVERFQVTVMNQNRLPSIESFEPSTNVEIDEGQSQVFEVNAKDPDNEELELKWYLDGTFVGTASEYEYSPSFTDAGEHEIKVVATDASDSVDHTWVIQVININKAPEVQEIGELRVPEGDAAVITVIATDADGETLTYSIDDERFEQQDNVFTWQTTFQDSGIYDIEITVSDGEAEVKQVVKVIVANFNHLPQILDYQPKSTKYIAHDAEFTFSVTVFDSDDEPLITKWYVDNEEKTSGESFVFNPEGKLQAFTIKAVVSDGNATAEHEFNVESIDRPILNGFDGETTDISEGELTSITDFTLQKSKVKVKFLEPVDLSDTIDVENNVLLQNSKVALNSQEIPALNKPARITFYSTSFSQNPIIYYSEGFGAGSEEICPPDLCYDIQYDGNSLSFTVAHFTTYIIRETPFKQYNLHLPEKLVIGMPENSNSVDEDFSIRNTGLQNLNNIEILGVFPTSSLTVLPVKVDLDPGETESISVQGTVSRPAKAGKQSLGNILIKNNHISETIPVYLELKEKLSIDSLEIAVNDKTYSGVDDEDKIKVKPGDHIELEFDIENTFDDDTKIDDVYITAELDDDFDESDEFSLTAGNYKSKILELDLPKLLDESRFDLLITVEGEDEHGTDYLIEWTVNVKVDREKHDTRIEGLEFVPEDLECRKETRLLFNLLNYGSADEEGLKIDVQNKELEIDIQDFVDLDEASETEFRYRIIFDENKPAGEYKIPVNIYYDDGLLADSQEAVLKIGECGVKAAKENPVTTIKVQTSSQKLDNSHPILRKNDGDETITLATMLIILLALLVILAALLLMKALY